MTHETLFKRTKTGAIQYWKVLTSPDEHHGCHIVKESGQLGTISPITHREFLNCGKNVGRSNETTPEEQAESQALSDWTKKHDEGYKTLKDLGIITPGEDHVFEIGNGEGYFAGYGTLEAALNNEMPKFNSDSNGNPKPMLATCYTKVKNITYPCYIQPKLDGVRCLMVVDTDANPLLGGPVKFLSRSGKDYLTLGHISSDVITYLADQLEHPIQFILDGELYNESISFQEIIQAVKKQCPNSLKLKFRAYDIVNNQLQKTRLAQVKELVKVIDSPHVVLTETYIAHDLTEVKKCHDQWVNEGNEGAMIRLTNGSYSQGQRSRELLKVKEFDETEYKFYGWDLGQRLEDLLALCATENGSQFKAKMIGTREQKEALYIKYQGTNITSDMKLTVKHFGLTTDGLPRFPIGKGIRDYE